MTSPQRRNHFYGWIVLSVLSLLYLLENFDRYLIAVSVIPYIDYSSYEYSLLVGPVFTVIYAIGGLLFSLAHNDSGDGILRKVSSGKFAILFLSTLIFSISFGLTALCDNFWQQVLVRVVMGLAQSVITPFSASIIRSVFPPEQSGTAFSIFNVGVYLAFSMSLSLGVWLYHEYGWKIGYLLFGLIGAGFSFVIPLLACWSARSSAFADEKRIVVSSYNPLISDEHSVVLSGVNDLTVNLEISGINNTITTSQQSGMQNVSTISESSDLSLNSLETIAMSQRKVGTRTSDEFSDDPSSRKSGEYDEDNVMNTITYYCKWSHVQSSWSLVKRKLHRIVIDHWWHNPSIIFLCLATGVRLGAGYVWSSYTGPFFSDLFVNQENSIHCSFSYDEDLVKDWVGEMCASEAFPFCVSGTCSAVSRYPWHNKGMDPMNLAAYMSWVPLVGSGLGNLVGGIVSDKVIRGDWLCFSLTKGISFHSDVSHHRPNRSHWRALISGISTLLALPFVCIAFYLDFPGCYLILIASGLMGEMYLSQTLALITEPSFISADLITSSVALFILLTTAIAGNATLLVPFLQTFTNQENVTITFEAASSDPTVPGNQWMSTSQTSAEQLQEALVYAMIFCYGLSGVLYICAYWAMLRKLPHV